MMKISLLDRSLYYKGLLLLIRQDRRIHDEEKKMMLGIGKMLGFDPKFCAKTIEEILKNNHIDNTPPVFSKPDIALCFIRDGLSVSASDGQIHEAEIQWLNAVAKHNGLDTLQIGKMDKASLLPKGFPVESLELKNFEWE